MMGKIREYEAVAGGDGLRYCRREGIGYQADGVVSVEYGDAYWANYVRYEGSPIADALNEFRVMLTERYCDHVLDIGIGCGTFIGRLSIPSYGYDVNPVGVRWLEDRGIYRDPYAGIPPEVDGITLWDVIEHMPNPDDLLARVPAGVHVITSMPIFGDLADIAGSRHYKPGEHLYYFTRYGLMRYMHDMGYQMQICLDDETRLGRDGIGTFVFEKVSLGG